MSHILTPSPRVCWVHCTLSWVGILCPKFSQGGTAFWFPTVLLSWKLSHLMAMRHDSPKDCLRTLPLSISLLGSLSWLLPCGKSLSDPQADHNIVWNLGGDSSAPTALALCELANHQGLLLALSITAVQTIPWPTESMARIPEEYHTRILDQSPEAALGSKPLTGNPGPSPESILLS